MKSTDNISTLNYLETNYPVSEIKVADVCVWMYLRNVIWDRLENKGPHNLNSTIISGLISAQNYYWNFKNRNNDCQCVLFTDTLEEIKIGDQHIDRLMCGVTEELGNSLCVVLNPLGETHTSSSMYIKNKYISSHYFTFGLPKKHPIKGKDILDDIVEYLNIPLDYQSLINKFIMYFNRTYNFLKKSKPNKVVVNCYHSSLHQAAVLSANSLGIPIYEIQHGLISKMHYPYNFSNCVDSNFLPNHLFSFGNYVNECVGSAYKNHVNIIPVGNAYLNAYIKNGIKLISNKNKFEEIVSKSKSYEKIVLVSHQNSVSDELGAFINNLADRLNNVLFIYSIRNKDNQQALQINNQGNVIINSEIDIYSLAKHCDLHISVYSTFILESLYMGIPNILININGLSVQYLNDIVGQDNVLILSADNEVADAINGFNFEDSDTIKENMSYLYTMKNINSLVEIVLSK